MEVSSTSTIVASITVPAIAQGLCFLFDAAPFIARSHPSFSRAVRASLLASYVSRECLPLGTPLSLATNLYLRNIQRSHRSRYRFSSLVTLLPTQAM